MGDTPETLLASLLGPFLEVREEIQWNPWVRARIYFGIFCSFCFFGFPFSVFRPSQ